MKTSLLHCLNYVCQVCTVAYAKLGLCSPDEQTKSLVRNTFDDVHELRWSGGGGGGARDGCKRGDAQDGGGEEESVSEHERLLPSL